MTGNVALDVSIGLVFIYLLFSLYATVLMEIIASSLGLRARNLSYALKRMLMDEKKYSNGTAESMSRVWTTIIQMWGKSSNLTNQRIYNSFFNQPTIKYLNNGGISSKPSYISSQMFVKALIDTIKVDDPGISLAASIEQGLLQLDSDLAEEFKKRGEDADSDRPLSETISHIESLMRDANGDILKFKILLENWYNETMSRASGWYKRTVQIFLLLLGLCISFSFNVNTVAIVKKLSNDPDAREQMVNLAKSYIEEHPDSPDSVTSVNESTDPEERRKYLEATRKELLKEIENSQQLLASGWHIERRYQTYSPSRKESLPPDSIECVWKLPDGKNTYATVHASIDKGYFEGHYEPQEDGVIKISPFWYRVGYVWRHPGGYFLTMLAISLGAPFWFDILNKLVKLRTSKAADEPSKNASSGESGTKSDILNRAG